LKQFKLKDAILLCFGLLGIQVVVCIPFVLAGLYFQFIYSLVLLIIIIFLVRNKLIILLAWKEIPIYLFLALSIMYFGFEIINAEILCIIENYIPIPKDYFNENYNNLFSTIILTAIFPAFTEELFYRGIILRKLCSTYSKRTALVMSAVLFGMMHLNIWQFVHAGLSGLLYGWLYLRYKTIWLNIFMHFLNNTLASVPFYPIEQTPLGFFIVPIWFFIIGIILFGIGLGLVIGITKTSSS
jgi:membrane protease YdiL (CAAX protease family)